MNIAIVADTFPPLRTSGAVQLRDLAREFCEQGHNVTMMIASPEVPVASRIETDGAVRVIRLKGLPTKNIGYFRRTMNEFLTPFSMIRNFQKSPLCGERFEGVIWYSPSIFLGPFVRAVKRQNQCPSYLIVRDIFPQWAADMGLMSRGLAYRLLNYIAQYQYSIADVIGVQSPGNLAFLQSDEAGRHDAKLEVLHNWLGKPADKTSSIDIECTPLAGRRIFVYAGNMGIAQGVDKLIGLAQALHDRSDIGLLFVGRGSEASRFALQVEAERLDNVLVHDEIDPDEIPALFRQCHAGLVALDSRHTTHNIPGKFLAYLQSGLPVLASVNPGNDLVSVIAEHKVGRVSVDPNGIDLAEQALCLLDDIAMDHEIQGRCQALSDNMFSAAVAVRQLTAALGAV